MFYKDYLPINSQSMLKIKLSDFSSGLNTKIAQNVLPLNVASSTYNFNFNSGSLVEGMGFCDLTMDNHIETATQDYYWGTKTMVIPTGVQAVQRFWFYRRFQEDLFKPAVIMCADNELYYCGVYTNENTFKKLMNHTFDIVPSVVNFYADRYKLAIFSKSASDSISEVNDRFSVTTYNSAPRIFAMEPYGARLFAIVGTTKDELWFSDEMNPCAWVAEAFQGGFIKLVDKRGRLQSLIAHNNYLYIIREYGISRLSGLSNPEDYVIKHLSYSPSRICGSTATLCGDDIYMLCYDGLYRFDGINLYKIELGFESMLEGENNKNAVGAYVAGKFYVACRLNFNDDVAVGCESEENYVHNCLIEYDVDTGEYSILRGVDICCLLGFNVDKMHKLIACFNTQYQTRLGELTHDGKLFSSPTKKIWKSPKSDLGYPDRQKVVKNFYVNTKYDLKVKFIVDDKTYSYIIKGKNKPSRIMTAIKGSIFQFELESNTASCDISNPQIEIVLC